MSYSDIIRMAREQGCPETATDGVFLANADDLGRLLAAERERAALKIEQLGMQGYGTLAIAAAIRKGQA